MSERTGSGFHAARWDEPLIDEIGGEGGRGLLPPAVATRSTRPLATSSQALLEGVGRAAAGIARTAAAPRAPALPQLSQMSMGFDVTADMMGTCTMKYSPKVHEYVARMPGFADVHPLQDPERCRARWRSSTASTA